MSELRQVGPNEWLGPQKGGITPRLAYTDYAKAYYERGNVKHEPLMPGNHIVPIDYEDTPKAAHMGEFWDAYSAGGHETFLDMRVESSHSRGNIFYSMLLAAFLWGGFKCLTVWAWGSKAWALTTMDQCILSLFAFVVLVGFFRPVALPIRLHKRNQEVYVKHKGVLYRIPWQECEISVVYSGFYLGAASVKDSYQLVMWLNPKYAVNRDLTGQKHSRLILNEVTDDHVMAYGYYEYIRRYMTGDEPFALEISTKEKVARRNRELLNQYSRIRVELHYRVLIVVGFLLQPSVFALTFAPIKDKWPEEVHEWTGERCNWI